MTAAVSEALGRGAKNVICASTGNTAASAAAYAARAGMKAIVLIPEGKVAVGKLAGAAAYGAQIIQIDGSFDDALDIVVELTNTFPIALVNSINPYRIEGQKTSAFEICDTLGSAPDILCLPVGNAGNITAYWAGFRQYNTEKSAGLPQVLGVQAAGSATRWYSDIRSRGPRLQLTAIRIGKPARGEQALQAAEESGGRIIAAQDEHILSMQRLLAGLEGIWVEPASAAGLAGLKIQIEQGALDVQGKRIVAICTGHGMKDTNIITQAMAKPLVIAPEIDIVVKETLTQPMSIHVKVPATTANLGPGFDALGLALDLWNEADFSFREDGQIKLTVLVEGANSLPTDAENLVARSALRLFDLAGEACPGLQIDCLNRIPRGSGLGSSSAAVLTGLLGANGLLGSPTEQRTHPSTWQ